MLFSNRSILDKRKETIVMKNSMMAAPIATNTPARIPFLIVIFTTVMFVMPIGKPPKKLNTIPKKTIKIKFIL